MTKAIDGDIAAWHDSPSATSSLASLATVLGMTVNEYSRWVKEPSFIHDIIRARRQECCARLHMDFDMDALPIHRPVKSYLDWQKWRSTDNRQDHMLLVDCNSCGAWAGCVCSTWGPGGRQKALTKVVDGVVQLVFCLARYDLVTMVDLFETHQRDHQHGCSCPPNALARATVYVNGSPESLTQI